ncbi:MAG: SOS response-associated peptidase family protein [Clostridia bacterium]|nr:SOS response-associated peptidase family protein [Clostridia bacterium]MBQ8334427.1 SOS response-associated peptidase family protein [Clostridia bacterium]MBQ8369914.1 SOS response-associated peptidase family protein [Clostridia bacterium]MBQ8511423.1 SOS response-associated peptidase family protein [Clostridia bacterium]
MCGRYQAWIEDDELMYIIEREKRGSVMQYFRQNEVFPGTTMPLLYGSYASVRAHLSFWGFEMKSGKKSQLLINARSETVCEKPMFRQPFENERAVIPVTAYYEWSGGVKYRIFADDGAPLLLGAVEKTDPAGVRRHVILTSEAKGIPARIHDRMPLFIPRRRLEDWLYDTDYARRRLTEESELVIRAEAV